MRIRVLGDKATLPEDVRKAVDEVENKTQHCTGLNLNLALNYSSRWEITEAMRKIALKVQKNEILPKDITEQNISEHLTTAGMPDPDLLIRTSGEYRISNYLLWQMSYTEMIFTPILWPDFRRQEFIEAIKEFQKRERRFGKTSEQL